MRKPTAREMTKEATPRGECFSSILLVASGYRFQKKSAISFRPVGDGAQIAGLVVSGWRGQSGFDPIGGPGPGKTDFEVVVGEDGQNNLIVLVEEQVTIRLIHEGSEFGIVLGPATGFISEGKGAVLDIENCPGQEEVEESGLDCFDKFIGGDFFIRCGWPVGAAPGEWADGEQD